MKVVPHAAPKTVSPVSPCIPSTSMAPPATSTDHIVEKMASIDGVLRDDIHVSEDTVTCYVPTNKLEIAKRLEGVDIEVLEEHEYEYLVSVEAKSKT